MFKSIRKMVQEKREYKQMERRASSLPKDYRFVYGKIQHYMWSFSAGTGLDIIPIFSDLLDLFEIGATEKKPVLEITGEDVAAFCDELLRNTKTYTENWREKLNREIREKLGGNHNESK